MIFTSLPPDFSSRGHEAAKSQQESFLFRKIYIHAIRTALPFHKLSQDDIREFMSQRPGLKTDEIRMIDKIYKTSAINHRYSILDDFKADPDHSSGRSLFSGPIPPGTAERNRHFTDSARMGSLALVREMLNPDTALTGRQLGDNPFVAGPGAGGLSPWFSITDVTHLITVSCTGFSAPGFDIDLQKELGMSPRLERLHIGFMGCYAAFPALRAARSICAADPDARVLIVGVEFCTLHFQDSREKDSIIANSLFADGLAAVLLSSNPRDSRGGSRGRPLFSLGAVSSSMIGGGEDMMAWTLGDTGFLMKLSAYVPRLIEQNLKTIIENLSRQSGIRARDISLWALHPGGRAILDRARQNLELPKKAMEASYSILSRYGNMSAVTIYFVLAEMMKTKDKERDLKKKDRVFAAAFGPGLTVESAILCPLPSTHTLRAGVPSAALPRLIPDISRRSRLPELMDDPRVQEKDLFRTVRQFRIINRLLTGYRRILYKEVLKKIRHSGKKKEWTILDLGCGGGDVLRWLALQGRRYGLSLKLVGVDPDSRILNWARTDSTAFPEIHFEEGSSSTLADVSRRWGGFDFILSNHVMHHLYGVHLDNYILRASRYARQGVVLNDLRRSVWAYIGYTILAGLFFHKSLAFYDGRLSVLKSFRKAELESILTSLGLEVNLEVRKVFPFRLILTSKKRPEHA